MSRTLSQILIDANAYLDLEAVEPTGDDLTVRTNYAQQAVREWADAYEWKDLKTKHWVYVTNSTISLPSNYKQLTSIPIDQSSNQYPEIPVDEEYNYTSSQRYSFVVGNDSEGYTLTVNSLATQATLSFTYLRTPSNMATLTDVCEVPDDRFVVQRVIGMVLESRSDERFPTVNAEAQRLMANMIGRNNNRAPGGIGSVPRRGSARLRIGRR